MRYDWLLEPISEEAPCGPDLDEVGDEKYLELRVAGRQPDSRRASTRPTPTSRSTAARSSSRKSCRSSRICLRQSRDIRLLCIEARLQSFAGDLSGFSDCIVAIAGLVERFWADVHPKAFEGDFTLRQNVLSGLDDWWQIIQPLQHLPLVRDKRAGPITYRHFAVATARAQKRAGRNRPRSRRRSTGR